MFNSENASDVFRPHYAGGIKNVTITGYFVFVFEENSITEYRDYRN